MGAYNPKTNVMFIPLANAALTKTARTDREAKPEFVYNTTNVNRFPAGKTRSAASMPSMLQPPHGVELGNTRRAVLADSGNEQRLTVQRLSRRYCARSTRIPVR